LAIIQSPTPCWQAHVQTPELREKADGIVYIDEASDNIDVG
jgi:hypothetical protein